MRQEKKKNLYWIKEPLKERNTEILAQGEGEKNVPGDFICTNLPTRRFDIHMNLHGLGKFSPNTSDSVKLQGIWQKVKANPH